MRFALAWMKETAKPLAKSSSSKRKGPQKSANKNAIYEPEQSLEDLLELRENEEAFITFVKTFLKPVYLAKWKAKQQKEETTKLSDIMTVSDEAFVLLVIENNWERWIDMNNKAKNAYTASTRGESTAIDSDVMPKYTYINKRRSTDDATSETASVNWRGWNNEGILRFNDLCKRVKANRKAFPNIDKDVLAEIEPEENQQRPKKRRKALTPVVQAFVDSDEDDAKSNDDTDDESDEGSN